ncbi:MAG: polysaccharide deacetylase family protein [Solirubrobacteraceae bacterium]
MPVVAITVDVEFPDQPAGDALGSADEVLAVLARHEVRATFFVVGAWARANPDRVLAIRDGGHLIGNHSHSHCPLNRLTEAGIVEDLNACHDVLAELGIESRPWFRAPQGVLEHDGVDVRDAIAQAGYRHVHWDARGEDWRPGCTAEQVAQMTLDDVHRRWPGPAVVLLHSWPDPAAAALEIVLTTLRSEGAGFVTLDQLGWRHRAIGRLRAATARAS